VKVSIFGLGYVGAVSAGCLANDGHQVIGVDPLQTKIDLINQGRSPIIEKDVGELTAKGVKDGLLSATADAEQAVLNTEISFVCVGTPSQANGNLDLQYIKRVCEQIGAALPKKETRHSVVIRSTILPGTMRGVVIPALEEFSGKTAGVDFDVCNNPEFLREGTAVYDYYNPPKTVIGELIPGNGDLAASVFKDLDAPLIRARIETGEMVKYVDNVWHALKIGFANEIGNICKTHGIDGHEVMDVFCQDLKLNISSAYLKPGFAFGGSCLPKDVRALVYNARSRDVDVPIIGGILPSNQLQIAKGLQMVMSKKSKKVGILGFSFKDGTDDLRESPIIEVVERLLGKGYDLKLYDKNVQLARLVGANKEFINNRIPHISNLMVETVDEVLEHADTVVIGTGDVAFKTVPGRLGAHQTLVDFVRIVDHYDGNEHCDGICW
jgi:GDP-mannose 6-dehydrogenase